VPVRTLYFRRTPPASGPCASNDLGCCASAAAGLPPPPTGRKSGRRGGGCAAPSAAPPSGRCLLHRSRRIASTTRAA